MIYPRTTHTYAILEVSPDVYREIRKKLAAAGYGTQFHSDDGREVIDMHGIAIAAQALPAKATRTDGAKIARYGRRK